ncbi:rhomboid family intramembrane serine protease [Croceivirga sp. JEA036]|uniref:rhomboid family intramembrane serine protease n=1 Tax=Croceivirga sp. JEA036 TaxID=2721162 RepID=UPI00143A03DA|nr:rhomboid family intramembrane serine protease [Croceivirga sp. JEA036]NJB37243.1 rhomboid family intramembrane serine protease [Croceivirga sp. JEA036]
MQEENYFKFSIEQLLPPFLMVFSAWVVFWVEIKWGVNLNFLGVYPRTLEGLGGIFCSPFIHGSVEHLFNNSLPLFILSLALFYFYKEKAWHVLFIGWLVTGILTWLLGRPSYHIGASGLIYMLASFIFFKGVFQKYYRLVALSLTVVFIYGSMLWYIFPVEEGISWEGHLSGFLSGLVLAKLVTMRLPEKKKYDWEKEDYNEEEDEFLQHFDADGNFIEKLAEEPLSEISINYEYKPNKEEAD